MSDILDESGFSILDQLGQAVGDEGPSSSVFGNKIIVACDTNITRDSFIYATEQAGEYIGQPDPESANQGRLRPISSGMLIDEEITGTTDSIGDAGGLSIVDSELDIYGDGFLIGAVVTLDIGSGDETATVSGFSQSTGEVTFTSGFSGQVGSGTDYTITRRYEDLDVEIELTAAGDAGDAAFKLSIDGGVNYLGRNNPNQANWMAELNVTGVTSYWGQADPYTASLRTDCVCINDNGDILIFYLTATHYVACCFWSAATKTWSWFNALDTTSIIGGISVIKLVSGRLYAMTNSFIIFYSDENGVEGSWGKHTSNWDSGASEVCGVIQLSSGAIAAVRTYAPGDVYVQTAISMDGFSFSKWVTVASSANILHGAASICENTDGDIIVAYTYQETYYTIKAKKSYDGGSTYGSEIDVIDEYASADTVTPELLRDINGDIYCFAANQGTTYAILLVRSTDKGSSFNSSSPAVVISQNYMWTPRAVLYQSQILLTFGISTTVGGACSIHIVRRGMLETYVSGTNDIPVAMSRQKQPVQNGIEISWRGYAGINGDKWTFRPEYQYAMSNIIDPIGPCKPWRSNTDGIANHITIKGDNTYATQYRLRASYVSLFGCNFRTGRIQMNDTDSWDSPAVDQTVSFDLTSGTVDETRTGWVCDTSFSNYKDGELAGKYLRYTNGAASGNTYKIFDNRGEWAFTGHGSTNLVSIGDAFVVYGTNVTIAFSESGYYHINIAIDAQNTYEGFYQIGQVVVGVGSVLTHGWSIGYGKDQQYNIDIQRTAGNNPISIKRNNKQNILDLKWRRTADTNREIISLMDLVEGRPVSLIPDSTNLSDCYLVKHIGNIPQSHVFGDKFSIGIRFEELV